MKPDVFIHHEGALGDVILSLPVIKEIRGDSNLIHISARGDIGNFLKQTKVAEEISRSDSTVYISLYNDKPDHFLKRFFSNFGRAFIFTSKKNPIVSKSLSALVPDTIAIETIPPENSNIHVSEFRLRQLYNKTKPTSNAITNLYIPPQKLNEAYQLLLKAGYSRKVPLISIHPSSGGAVKCWKLENFFAVAETLMKKFKAFVIIFSGPAEKGTVEDKINNFINGKRDIIHVSMNELIMVSAFLNLSNLYIGNDSGISHLASLFCEKVMVIFGPTNPNLWSPRGENVTVIKSEQGCAPCSLSTQSHCTDRKCLTEITVSKVLQEANNIFI